MGVHDANIIYSKRHTQFGHKEISRLTDCGLKNLKHENTPLWHWYNLCKKSGTDGFIAYKSFSSFDEDVSVGALEVMRLLATSPPSAGEYIDRNFFIKDWLSDNSPDSIKLAALNYLKYHGKHEDLSHIQSELDQASPKTSRVALEAIVSIQLRYNKGEALQTVFENQFDQFDTALLEGVLSVPSTLDDETLKLGLKHRSKSIRLEALRRLRKRQKLSSDEIQELKSDPSALIRKETVNILISGDQSLSDKEVRNILVKPQQMGGFTWFTQPKTDTEGETCYDEYLFTKYHNIPERDLLEIVEKASIFNEIPYLALCTRYFKKHSEELRKTVDNQFEGKFEAYIAHLKNIGASDDNIKETRNIEEYLRKRLTRSALNILCKKGETKDLDRIRNSMRSEYVKSSEDEIEYMRKLGEWEDIPFIFGAEKDFASTRASLLLRSTDDGWNSLIAKAIYNIGKDRLGELFELDIPPPILVDLIKASSSSKFSEIPDHVLWRLLDHKDDRVRKFASLKCVQSFKKSKLQSLLTEYLEGEEHRYYNVIFWLDFGVAMPKSIIKRALNLLLLNDS